MELKEAIEVVRNIDTTDIHCKECVLKEKDKCITDLFGYSCQRIAIDTVLEELDNRISKDELKNVLRRVQDYQLNYKDTVLFNIIMQEIFGETEWINLENKE